MVEPFEWHRLYPSDSRRRRSGAGGGNKTGANSGGMKSSTHRTQGQIAAETTAKMNEATQKPAAKSLCRHKEWRQCNRSHKRQRIPPLHWPMPKQSKTNIQKDPHRHVLQLSPMTRVKAYSAATLSIHDRDHEAADQRPYENEENHHQYPCSERRYQIHVVTR